jgi:hypothetical protein
MTQWATKRKFIYGAGVLVVLAIWGIYLLRGVLFPVPTCFDQKQNGYETGVDCGGVCSLRCQQEIIPLSVSWARAVPVSSNTYDLVALLSNKNVDNAPQNVRYTFSVYDQGGNLMATTSAVTTVPVDGDFPVVIQHVTFPKVPGEVTATLNANVPHYTVAEKPTTPTLRVSPGTYEAGSVPRVYATVTNQKRIILKDIPVRAVLYDIDGNAYAAGQTVIPVLDKEASQDVAFTWAHPLPFAPTKIRIYPILDPFLGL